MLDFNGHDDVGSPAGGNAERDELRAALLARLESVLFALFPASKVVHGKFVVGDVLGSPGRSLEIELDGDRAGLWIDRATGNGGDIFALIAAHRHWDTQRDFAAVLGFARELLGRAPAVSPVKRKASALVDELGPATAKWDYLATDGSLIACVYRYEPAPGRKEFRPWDAKRRKMAPPDPRPLFNQPGIAHAEQVILVEGEKCAQALIDAGYCATTAMHGANAPIDKTDWSPLQGKHVLIWPDRDKPGWEYAMNAAEAVMAAGAHHCAVLMPPAHPTEDAPQGAADGWDAADALADGFDVQGFLGDGERIQFQPSSTESGQTSDPTEPSVWATEDALALTFSGRYAQDWRYVALWGKWVFWTGKRWQTEETLAAHHLMRQICREAALKADSHRVAAKLASSGTVAGLERLARSDRRHAATADEWDADPWLLNTPGGVVNLKDGVLRSHDRLDRLTKITTATPSGDCPTWRQFLNEVTGGDQTLQAYLARMAGYALTGSTREHALFFLYGNLTRLSALFEGVQRQIGAAVIPVLADFTEQVILAQTETGSFSNELQRITANREATLAFLESIASGLAFIAESAVLLKRVIVQPFDSLSVVGKDIETWFKTELLTFYKNYGFDAQAIDAEIAKLQDARDDYVRAANDRLFNINQNPGYADRVARFFDEQRRTVRVMGQRFVLDTEAQAREVQAIYDRFLPTVPRAPRPPANLDLGAFARPAAAAKPDEGEAFLNQLRTRLLRTQEGEAAELRARALQIEAKGYQGVASQAERYIQVLEAIERQKEADKAFDAYEKEEAASRKITEGLIGGNRQRIEALQLQREMLDLSNTERTVLQTRAELERAAAAARKEASQLQDADLRAQTIEAINDALARQLPIVENLIRANAEYQRSTEFGAKAALRTYIEDATNAAKQAERAVTGAFKSMEDALTQFVMTGKLDFNSLANSIISDLIRIQIQRAITLPLANFAMSLFAPAASAALPLGSGDLMGVNANVAHSGGLLGADGLPSRHVDPALFVGARRFHTGSLVSGEVPIIARQGEAVFTPGQLRALGGAVAAKPQVNVHVNVINRASGVETRVEQQQQPDGSTRLDVIVEQMEARMARSISQGSGLAPTLEHRYGLNPAAGAMR